MPLLVHPDDWGDYSKTPAPANAATLLAAASGAIQSYCGWSIVREIVQDAEFDTNGSSLLALPTMHLVSIEALWEEDLYLEDRADYRWSRRGLIRRKPKGKVWPNEFGSVRGDYTHGYETCPPELAALCVNLAKRTDVIPSGLLQKQVGGISVQFKDTNLSETDMQVLDAFALESGRDH